MYVIKHPIQTKGTILNKCYEILSYTDDIVIAGKRIQDVNEACSALDEQTLILS